MEVKRRALASLLCASMALAPVHAFAEPKKPPTDSQMNEARTRYERGLKLYNEGAYDAALVEMQRAYELAPSFKILYNLGLIHRQLNDYAAALRAFTQYLAEGGKKIAAPRKAEVEKSITELKARVATIEIVVDVEGAEITIDDAPVGTSPLAEPVLVNAGKRKVSAKVAGKPASTKVVTVAGTDTLKLGFELADPKPPPPPPPGKTVDDAPKVAAPAPSRPSSEVKPKIPYVAWAVTGGLLVGAGVTGFLAYRSSRNLADERESPMTTRADLDDARAKTRTFSVITDVLLVGAVVAGGVSLYLTLKAPSPSDDAGKTAASSLRIRAAVAPNGIALVGDF